MVWNRWRSLSASAILFSSLAFSQQADRLTAPIDNARTVLLKGSMTPRALPANDRGPMEPGRRLTAMTLLFKLSPDQQAALDQLLQDQQTASSPQYHKWLTPQQYADRFGLSAADFTKAAAWLTAQGFSVDYSAQTRTWILFSGTAQQVQAAFHTSIHYLAAAGVTHFAPVAEPSIPAALEPVAQLIQGLDDFRMEPPKRDPKFFPSLAQYTSASGNNYLAPGDLATIYDVTPLYNHGITGSGMTLAVVGQTNIVPSDISTYRATFGLPVNDPQLVLVPGSADPGVIGDQIEANLDLEVSGGVAPNATVLYVYSQNVVLSVQYVVDQGLAPVLSMSYGGCELQISSTPASTANAYRTLAQQANAEGITWLASSDDVGAAGCDPNGSATASGGLSVDMPASIPEVTAVGGTTFNESTGTYWSPSNSSNNSSATSYIPETAWNDTLLGNKLAASGGGVSVFFTKPSWQSAPGVPNDGARDVPDVALSASAYHDAYLIVMNGQVTTVGGTSAATPAFAGMVTLLNQALVSSGAQSKPGLGNINPALYGLARSSAGVFHDIVSGSNIVPCVVSTLNCPSTGQFGYSAGPGYDPVTGLGSVDTANMVASWGSNQGGNGTNGTSITLTASPANLPVTSSTTLVATVRSNSGSTPNGAVTFAMGGNILGSVNLAGSGSSASASLTVYGSQLTVGANTISASYGGGAGFSGSSASTVVTITVPTSTSAIVPSIVPNPVYQQTPTPDGYSFFFTVSLTEIAGVATTLTDFTFFGTSYASSIPNFFGTASIPPHGTISAALEASVDTVPSTGVIGFTGRDASGISWSQQITVPFLPMQTAAAMALTSAPSTVVRNPTYDPHCSPQYPFYQQLDLQEKNGFEVQLTKFLAGGADLSSSIQQWFGSWRLAPLGSLQSGICWSLQSVPSSLSYEIDGIDTKGNAISVTASTPFQGPGQSVGTLSASRTSIAMVAASGQNATAGFTVNVPAGQQWSLAEFPFNQNTSWLVYYPQSGTGPAQVNLSAFGSSLSNGAYTATLVLQSVNSIPQFVNIPVTFTVGPSGTVSIGGVANAASYQQAAAPGMLMYVGGSGLSNSSQIQIASAVPLPYSIGGVSATVNGIPAPIYYVLPQQIVIQVPYETPIGYAFLAVNNNGNVATYSFPVSPSAPGIFTDSNAQLVPTGSAKHGQSLAFFMTGEGDVTGGLATGSPPSTSLAVNQLPAPRLPFQLTVGGVSVTPLFVGIPYGLVGVTQVNFTVPSTAPTGLQPVVVTVGTNSSVVAKINITQ